MNNNDMILNKTLYSFSYNCFLDLNFKLEAYLNTVKSLSPLFGHFFNTKLSLHYVEDTVYLQFLIPDNNKNVKEIWIKKDKTLEKILDSFIPIRSQKEIAYIKSKLENGSGYTKTYDNVIWIINSQKGSITIPTTDLLHMGKAFLYANTANKLFIYHDIHNLVDNDSTLHDIFRNFIRRHVLSYYLKETKIPPEYIQALIIKPYVTKKGLCIRVKEHNGSCGYQEVPKTNTVLLETALTLYTTYNRVPEFLFKRTYVIEFQVFNIEKDKNALNICVAYEGNGSFEESLVYQNHAYDSYPTLYYNVDTATDLKSKEQENENIIPKT